MTDALRWNSPEARAAARERSKGHQERRRANAATKAAKRAGRLDVIIEAAYGPVDDLEFAEGAS